MVSGTLNRFSCGGPERCRLRHWNVWWHRIWSKGQKPPPILNTSIICRSGTQAIVFVAIAVLAGCCHINKPTSRHRAELDSLMIVFFNEAHQRGRVLNPTGVTVEFGHLLPRSGSCRPKSYPRVVTIDSITWRAANRHVREMLLFHELGHCLFGLPHDNTQLPLGECRSWMRENDQQCVVNTVNRTWRSYYLDVLFSDGPCEPPLWYAGRASSPPGVVVWHAVPEDMNGATGFRLDTTFTNSDGNWRVEAGVPPDEWGYVFFLINEYRYEYSSYRGGVVHEYAGVQQYRNNENNHFKSGELSLPKTRRLLSLEKKDSTVYLNVDDSTTLCIPVSTAEVHVVVYNAFRNGGLSIRIPTLL